MLSSTHSIHDIVWFLRPERHQNIDLFRFRHLCGTDFAPSEEWNFHPCFRRLPGLRLRCRRQGSVPVRFEPALPARRTEGGHACGRLRQCRAIVKYKPRPEGCRRANFPIFFMLISPAGQTLPLPSSPESGKGSCAGAAAGQSKPEKTDSTTRKENQK